MQNERDPWLRVERVAFTPGPQFVCWLAAHQDYCEKFAFDDKEKWPENEGAAGKALIRHLLANERGHYGPLEHASIVLNFGYFPHCVISQARTHRVGVSFDVQSMRYTGQRMAQVASGEVDVEEAFYFRPLGEYRDRKGHKYEYTEGLRDNDKELSLFLAQRYTDRLKLQGFAEEHARENLPYNFRQHFVASFSLRAALHFLDLRAKKDAQLEIQQMCELMVPHLEDWVPDVWGWYEEKRLGKARLAP